MMHSTVLYSKDWIIKHQNPAYSVNCHYPQMRGTQNNHQQFNKLVIALIKKRVRQFRDHAQHPIKNFSSYLNINYKTTYLNPSLFISITFTQASYYAGAAHPNQTSFVINYDPAKKTNLTLGALFKNADYLQTLSTFSIAMLKQYHLGDINFIQQGAAPQQKNFRNWNITPYGLLITFDPTQVAAYVYGSQQVMIPKGILLNRFTNHYQGLWQ